MSSPGIAVFPQQSTHGGFWAGDERDEEVLGGIEGEVALGSFVVGGGFCCRDFQVWIVFFVFLFLGFCFNR